MIKNQSVSEVVLEIKKMYDFLELDEQMIYTVIQENFQNRSSCSQNKILKFLQKYFDNYILNKVQEEDYTILINYVLRKVRVADDVRKNISTIDELASFLNQFGILNNANIIQFLISNSVELHQILQVICESSERVSKEVYKFTKEYCEMYQVFNDFVIDDGEDACEKESLFCLDDILNQADRCCDPTAKNEEMLREYSQTHDEELLKKLVYKNIGLVVSIAKKFSREKVLFIDLVSEGIYGLIKGIKNYDPNAGILLSTYVCPIIWRVIERNLSKTSRPYTYGKNFYRKLKSYERYFHKYYDTYGVYPSYQEQSDRFEIPVDQVMEINRLLGSPISIDECFFTEGKEETPVSENLNVEDLDSEYFSYQEKLIIQYDLDKSLLEFLDEELDEIQKYIILLRCGFFHGGSEITYGQVAQCLYRSGLTPRVYSDEAIRLRLKTITQKLQKSEKKTKLKAFI